MVRPGRVDRHRVDQHALAPSCSRDEHDGVLLPRLAARAEPATRPARAARPPSPRRAGRACAAASASRPGSASRWAAASSSWARRPGDACARRPGPPASGTGRRRGGRAGRRRRRGVERRGRRRSSSRGPRLEGPANGGSARLWRPGGSSARRPAASCRGTRRGQRRDGAAGRRGPGPHSPGPLGSPGCGRGQSPMRKAQNVIWSRAARARGPPRRARSRRRCPPRPRRRPTDAISSADAGVGPVVEHHLGVLGGERDPLGSVWGQDRTGGAVGRARSRSAPRGPGRPRARPGPRQRARPGRTSSWRTSRSTTLTGYRASCGVTMSTYWRSSRRCPSSLTHSCGRSPIAAGSTGLAPTARTRSSTSR